MYISVALLHVSGDTGLGNYLSKSLGVWHFTVLFTNINTNDRETSHVFCLGMRFAIFLKFMLSLH